MKKFTFKGVLDGFRTSVANQQARTDQEIVETLRPDHFQVAKVRFEIYKMAAEKVCLLMRHDISWSFLILSSQNK